MLLVERDIGVAQESSAKSGGILTDLLWHPEDQELVVRSRELYREARERSGDMSVAREIGMLTLAEGESIPSLERRMLDLRERGVRHELLHAGEISRRHPALDRLGDAAVGLFMPDDWSLNPTAFAQAALDDARELGLAVRFGCRALRLGWTGSTLDVVSAQEEFHGRRVLVAAGTWSRKVLQTAGLDIPLLPYRVQLSSLQLPRPHALPIVWDVTTDVYLVPDGPENVLAGYGTRLWEHDPDSYDVAGDSDFHLNVAERVPAHWSIRTLSSNAIGAQTRKRPATSRERTGRGTQRSVCARRTLPLRNGLFGLLDRLNRCMSVRALHDVPELSPPGSHGAEDGTKGADRQVAAVVRHNQRNLHGCLPGRSRYDHHLQFEVRSLLPLGISTHFLEYGDHRRSRKSRRPFASALRHEAGTSTLRSWSTARSSG